MEQVQYLHTFASKFMCTLYGPKNIDSLYCLQRIWNGAFAKPWSPSRCKDLLRWKTKTTFQTHSPLRRPLNTINERISANVNLTLSLQTRQNNTRELPRLLFSEREPSPSKYKYKRFGDETIDLHICRSLRHASVSPRPKMYWTRTVEGLVPSLGTTSIQLVTPTYLVLPF